jgi:hypothetical protein
VLLTKYYAGDQFEKIEMGGACGTNGKQERCIHISDIETLGKEITWKTHV